MPTLQTIAAEIRDAIDERERDLERLRAALAALEGAAQVIAPEPPEEPEAPAETPEAVAPPPPEPDEAAANPVTDAIAAAIEGSRHDLATVTDVATLLECGRDRARLYLETLRETGALEQEGQGKGARGYRRLRPFTLPDLAALGDVLSTRRRDGPRGKLPLEAVRDVFTARRQERLSLSNVARELGVTRERVRRQVEELTARGTLVEERDEHGTLVRVYYRWAKPTDAGPTNPPPPPPPDVGLLPDSTRGAPVPGTGAAEKVNGNVRPLLEAARAAGAEVRKNSAGHWNVTLGGKTTTIPSTPGSRNRAVQHARARLRRIGVPA